MLAGMAGPAAPVVAGDPARSDTDELLGAAGLAADTDRRAADEGSGGMSAIGIDDIEGLIGVAQYEEVGEFPVEQGYVWTTCSSVENGNPLFWDPDGGRGGDRGPDRPADHGVGVVPAPPLGPGPHRRRACPCRSTST